MFEFNLRKRHYIYVGSLNISIIEHITQDAELHIFSSNKTTDYKRSTLNSCGNKTNKYNQLLKTKTHKWVYEFTHVSAHVSIILAWVLHTRVIE